MIFLDANVFLRFFVVPQTPQDWEMALQCKAMFERARTREIVLTTSDAIIAEVAFILTSPRHYGISRSDASLKLKSVLTLDGFQFIETTSCLRALDFWVANERVSFPDSLAAAISERYDHHLATFDSQLKRLESVSLYQFPDVSDRRIED